MAVVHDDVVLKTGNGSYNIVFVSFSIYIKLVYPIVRNQDVEEIPVNSIIANFGNDPYVNQVAEVFISIEKPIGILQEQMVNTIVSMDVISNFNAYDHSN